MAGPEVQQSASEPIFGKKFMSKLGGMANESAASTVSAFARKQMEKMGWTEGKGLGKEEQGVVTHVRVKKREEFMGVRLYSQRCYWRWRDRWMANGLYVFVLLSSRLVWRR